MRPAALVAAIGLVGCYSDPPIETERIDETCAIDGGTAVSFDAEAEPCQLLSSYRFFADGRRQLPNDDVVPYDVNTPLFSDYSTKRRFLWVPPGASIGYVDDGPLQFPVGSVLIKSFGFADDLGDPASEVRLVETRLLVNRADGWRPVVYRWDEAQTDARLAIAGGVVEVSWTHTDGVTRDLPYIVPNINQCEGCHTDGDALQLLGPRARHLNRSFDYPGGPENQLTHLAGLGLLDGAPVDPDTAPRAPVFDDPTTGTVEERARAWLDINCAHCHNPDGPARSSGLDLRVEQDNPVEFGVCKTPVAAGGGSGGLQYNIVPGEPDMSILVFRIESVEPDVRMPELLRQTVHAESAAVIREWIGGLQGDCGGS